MVVKCEEVWNELSNYLDGEVDVTLREAIDDHVHGCQRCTAVLAGTRNIVHLYGDERMSEVPLGFSHRLHRRLEESMSPSRRSFLGWTAAFATGILVAGGFELARSSPSDRLPLRSEQAAPGKGVPPGMMVVVARDGKTFHVASCPFIHDKVNLRTIEAREAVQEGYTPCVRCMKKYLAT